MRINVNNLRDKAAREMARYRGIEYIMSKVTNTVDAAETRRSLKKARLAKTYLFIIETRGFYFGESGRAQKANNGKNNGACL